MGKDTATEPAAEKARAFKNLMEALRYLQGQGWKIEKSAIYNHKRDGLIKQEKNGGITQAEADRYARKNLSPLDGSDTPNTAALKEKEQAAIVRIKEAQAERLELKAKNEAGELVSRHHTDQELAKRVALFKNDSHQQNQADLTRIIDMVDGDREKGPELLEYLNSRVDQLLDRYARRKTALVPRALVEGEESQAQ